jgi:hypothetical protein
MSVTAFPVLARILIDRGMRRTRIGSIALASAATDDVLAWLLLDVVVAIVGPGSQQFRLLLGSGLRGRDVRAGPPAPAQANGCLPTARPAHAQRSRSGAGRAAAVLLRRHLDGLKYFFGAFLFGVVMPREGAAAALREEILDRLEQVSVLMLLPVFFVVSGLSVNLSSVGLSGLVDSASSCWSLSWASSAAPSSAPALRGSVAGAPGFSPP